MVDQQIRAAERQRQRIDWLSLRREEILDPDLPIIDPHHHLWDRGGHRYLIPELTADTSSGHAVTATVYMECLFGYREDGPEAMRPVGETESIANMFRDGAGMNNPTRLCAGIIGRADLALGDAVRPVLEAHIAAGQGRFRGIRYATAWDSDTKIHSAYGTAADMLGLPAVRRGVAALAPLGLSFDAWIYFHQLSELARLAAQSENVTIILNHCGGPIGIGRHEGHRAEVFDHWRAAMADLARLPNVFVKLGGLGMAVAGFGWHKLPAPPSSSDLAAAWRPYIETCIEMFGVGRCMFESNFPVDNVACSYTTLWNSYKILTKGASSEERAALFAETARQVYRL